MTTTKTNTLATITEYRALTTNTNEVLAVIHENLGNEKMTDRDLDRIILDGLSWSVPTLEGDESVKALDGIIVHWTTPELTGGPALTRTVGVLRRTASAPTVSMARETPEATALLARSTSGVALKKVVGKPARRRDCCSC